MIIQTCLYFLNNEGPAFFKRLYCNQIFGNLLLSFNIWLPNIKLFVFAFQKINGSLSKTVCEALLKPLPQFSQPFYPFQFANEHPLFFQMEIFRKRAIL